MHRPSLLAVGFAVFMLAGCGSSTRVPAPALVGLRLDIAQDTLDATGLRYETVGGGAFGVVVRSHWTVCRQTPEPGVVTSTVTLTVARACSSPEPLVVPDVTSTELDDARRQLEADGFSVVAQSTDDDPILVESAWTVCDQAPEPGNRGRDIVLIAAHDCWDYP